MKDVTFLLNAVT